MFFSELRKLIRCSRDVTSKALHMNTAQRSMNSNSVSNAYALLCVKSFFDKTNKKRKMSFKILKFSAEWCGPCKEIRQPLLTMIEQANLTSYFHEIDADDHDDLIALYQVKALPTLIIVEEDTVTFRVEGADLQKITEGIQVLKNKHKLETTPATTPPSRFVGRDLPIDIAASINMDDF